MKRTWTETFPEIEINMAQTQEHDIPVIHLPRFGIAYAVPYDAVKSLETLTLSKP